MSITLDGAIGASDKHADISGGTLPLRQLARIGNELVIVEGFRHSASRAAGFRQDPTHLVITRGQIGTTAASHDSGAAVTPHVEVWGPDPLSSGGGGSISVTDGTTTVDPATSLRLPAGTLTDLGGGEGGVGLVFTCQSAPIAFDTPGLNNPNDNGADVGISVPAGSIVTAFATVDSPGWSAAGELILSLSTIDRSTAAQAIAGYTAQGDTTNAVGEIESAWAYPANSSALRRWAVAAVDCIITASFFPDAEDPVGGSGHVYAIIATPAASS